MLGAGRQRARGAERGERVGPVVREGEREWAARERVEVWAQARAAMGRRGGNRCGELGREAADWAGAGFAGPGKVWPMSHGLGCWRRRGDGPARRLGRWVQLGQEKGRPGWVTGLG